MRSNFLLGTLLVTNRARKALGRDPLDLIARHAINDHGLADLKQHKLNLKGFREADEIVSVYHVDPTNRKKGRVLVVTAPNWSSTTVKLEGE